MKLTKFDFWFLSSIFAFSLALKIFRLDSPSESYFDEGVYYIPAARDYLQGVFDSNFEHPPLAKLFMAAGIFIFGDNPWGWRIPGALVGSSGVIFIYLLGKRVFSSSFKDSKDKFSFNANLKEQSIPILASVFLAFEFSWFVSSRVATLEIYVATFSLAGAYFFWNLFKSEDWRYFILTGLFFGLAVASKWSAILTLGFIFLFYLWFQRKKITPALLKVVLIGLIVVGVYLASYSFYLAKHSFGDFVNLQSRMVNFHMREIPEREEIIKQKGVSSNYNRSSTSFTYPSWAWVFNPVYPYSGEPSSGNVKAVLFLFNPAIFWGALVAIVLAFKRLVKNKEKLFLAGMFTIIWLPWLFVPRYGFSYYLLSGIPFGILLLVKVLKEKSSENTFLLTGFVVAVVSSFLFFYPLLTNLLVPSWYLRILTGSSGFGP